MKPVFIAIVGPKKSGKTAVIEALTKELTRRRYRVAVIKHIPEINFTMDTKGKDTWRFAKAGATKIISVSSNEIATIERTTTKNLSLKKLLERGKGSDVVFIEGFRNLVSKSRHIRKIVVIRSSQEAKEAIQTFEPIIAFAGEGQIRGPQTKGVYLDTSKDLGRLADMIEKIAMKTP